MPRSFAASATPWAWLPEEKATTPLRAFVFRELQQRVHRPADLERAGALQVLALEPHLDADRFGQRRLAEERRAMDGGAEAGGGGADVVESSTAATVDI